MEGRTETRQNRRRRRRSGFGLMLLVAVGFAANSTLAAFAYGAGSDPLTVLSVRTTFAALAVFVLLRVSKAPAGLAPRQRPLAWGLGVLIAVYSYGLLGAIAFIPVALAVLTFYLYPLLTGVISALTGQEKLGPAMAVSLAAAFAGLVLALDITGGSVDLRGIAMAAMAAAVITAVILINRRLVGSGDSRPFTVHMMTAAALCYLIATPLAGGFHFPATAAGLMALAGVAGFYGFSIIGMFVALSMIGPVRGSMVMNFEPVASTIFAFALLGQALKPLQIVGVALVVGAVFWAQFRQAKKT